MAEPETPQIILVTPPEIDPETFPERLAGLLDANPVACLRLALASRDEDTLSRAADACREIAHARDIPIVVQDHLMLAERLGLDGVHLSEAAHRVRKARKALGGDAIIGVFCGASRHEGLSAGEAGADYIAFGPVGETLVGAGERAPRELFEWWSEMIELPVVAEGALTHTAMRDLAPVTDFFALGPEIWREDDPAGALAEYIRAMG